MRVGRVAFVAAAVVVLSLSGCGGESDDVLPSAAVSREAAEAAGQEWPLTVESGTVVCYPGNQIVFRDDASGREYYVNGLAKGADRWGDLFDIWADGEIEGLKVPMDAVQDPGSELCE